MNRSTLFVYLFCIVSFIGCSSDDPADKPIEFTFTSVTTESDVSSVTLKATYTVNRSKEKISEIGFLIGEAPGLTTEASEKLTSLLFNTNYAVKKQQLKPATTYFVRPFAVVEGVPFMGDESQVITSTPTFTSMTPVTAGRGERIQITGSFLTTEPADISILIGGQTASIVSFTATTLEVIVPEGVALKSNAAVSLKVKGYELPISQTIAISRFSKLTNSPFNTSLGSDEVYSYAFNGKLYYPTAGRIYDPATDTWSSASIANALSGRMTYAIEFNINGKGYAGFSDNGKKFYEFNPQNSSWTELNAFPGTGHQFLYGVWAHNNTKGYYGLGYNTVNNANTGLKEFWEYNPSNNQWTRLSDYPGLAITDGVAFSINEYIFMGGGYNRDGANYFNPVFRPEFYAYNTQQNNWVQVANFPVTPKGYRFNKVAVVGTKGYFFIGNSIWVYDFDSNSWKLSEDVIPGAPDRQSYDIKVLGNAIYILAGLGDVDGSGNVSYMKDFCKYYPQD